MSRTTTALMVWLACGSMGCAQDQVPARPNQDAPSSPRIHKLEELRWPQIDALDRDRTLFILPVGMLEVHGPHLPIGTDTLGLIYEVDNVARTTGVALPDWNIVVMPPIAYGGGGANELGGQLVHSGTYGIRQSTLRSLVADLGGQVAQNGSNGFSF